MPPEACMILELEKGCVTNKILLSRLKLHLTIGIFPVIGSRGYWLHKGSVQAGNPWKPTSGYRYTAPSVAERSAFLTSQSVRRCDRLTRGEN